MGIRRAVEWLLLSVLVGLLTGTAGAGFLVSLNWVTGVRGTHPWFLYLLPAAGLFIVATYHRFGPGTERGNRLIFNVLGNRHANVPLRLTPLIWASTLVTHLFGGSAGREGAAVQIGSSLAHWQARVFRLPPDLGRILLLCGMAGGFGSVFGVPWAGAAFAVELAIATDPPILDLRPPRQIHANGQMPLWLQTIGGTLIAGLVGDTVTRAWGVVHTPFIITSFPDLTILNGVKISLAAIAFGLASMLFVRLGHGCKNAFDAACPNPYIRSVVGGGLVLALVLALGTDAYIGLGTPMVALAFVDAQSLTTTAVPPLAFFWKSLLTALTLGTGFQGGEVLPLFFTGATLGHTLGLLLGLPPSLLAALGLAAVFGGATKTPMAALVMGVELFGLPVVPYLALTVVISYVCSGRGTVYPLPQPQPQGQVPVEGTG